MAKSDKPSAADPESPPATQTVNEATTPSLPGGQRAGFDPNNPEGQNPTNVAPAPMAAPAGTQSPTDDPAAALLARAMSILQASGIRPQAATPDLDETHPGGRYVVEGQEVNAWGKPFKEDQNPNEGNPELPRFGR